MNLVTMETTASAARRTLETWLQAIGIISLRRLTTTTLLRLEDAKEVGGELSRVLDGLEAGDGPGAERVLVRAECRGHTQAVCSMFARRLGTQIECLVAAPWNLLRAGDPADLRTIRGAGTALVLAAVAWSQHRGCGGKVSLQAANARALAFYERLGFRRVSARHDPLALGLLPPAGERAELHAAAGGERDRSAPWDPWMVFDPSVGPRRHPDASSRPAGSRLVWRT